MRIDLSFEGKHALVCGASDGIGRAIAKGLAAHGAQLTLLARRREKLEAVAAELKQAGAMSVRVLAFDLDDRTELVTTVQSLISEHGPVHILVNNSGGPSPGPILEATPEQFQQGLGRHLFASQQLLKAVLPGMREAGFGRILNVISTSVREPIPNLGVSNTVRGAMAAWAKTVAGELPPGITINNLLPGQFDTDRIASLFASRATAEGRDAAELRAEAEARNPCGRIGYIKEFGQACAYLCSAHSGYVVGQNLLIDGGAFNSSH